MWESFPFANRTDREWNSLPLPQELVEIEKMVILDVPLTATQ
jgi:hypothetical protein